MPRASTAMCLFTDFLAVVGAIIFIVAVALALTLGH
jgi:hypothetical protein